MVLDKESKRELRNFLIFFGVIFGLSFISIWMIRYIQVLTDSYGNNYNVITVPIKIWWSISCNTVLESFILSIIIVPIEVFCIYIIDK
jgi:hypothetical protein